MQPTYLPWIGYFDLIEKADVFVFYDTVQFEKQSWQQRNYIRNKDGKLLLTVPLKSGSGLNRKINEVEIDSGKKTNKRHLKSIEMCYSKSRNFNEIFPVLSNIYSIPFNSLIDLNVALIKFGMEQLNITTPVIFSNQLNVQTKKVEALIEICEKLEADHYYSPVGARGYIEENNLFSVNNIRLTFQSFNHPVYQQINFPDFISHLSFIDYLFNRQL